MPIVSVRLSKKEMRELLKSVKTLSESIREGISLYLKNENERKYSGCSKTSAFLFGPDYPTRGSSVNQGRQTKMIVAANTQFHSSLVME